MNPLNFSAQAPMTARPGDLPAHRRRTLTMAVGGAVLLAAVLTGCGTPPWEEAAAAAPASSATATSKDGPADGSTNGPVNGSEDGPEGMLSSSAPGSPDALLAAASGSPTAPAPRQPDVDGMAEGRAVHEVMAGSAPLRVTYWSTLPRDRWTPEAVKPLSLSVAADTRPGTVVTAADLIIETRRDGEPTGDPELTRVAALPSGGAAIDAPREFSWTAVLPPQDPSVTALRLILRLEVENTTGYGAPVVQTAVDELVVTLVP